MIHFTCFIEKIIKCINTKSRNGFVSISCLICFFLTIQILSFICVITLQNAYLLQANRQNIFDLSCISQAKYMIDHNKKIRLCHLNEEIIDEYSIEIDSILVTFRDENTYIDCSYSKNNRDFVMKIYYDDKSIRGFDIDEN